MGTPVSNGTKKQFQITVSLFLLMFAYALSYTMIGPLLPVIKSEYGITLSQSALITSFQGIGGALSVILGMFISGLFPKPTVIKAAFALYCVSALFITFMPWYVVLLMLFFMLGGSTRLVSAYLNAYIADIQAKKRAFYLNLLHACFGLGALAGPIFSTVFLDAHLNWRTAFIGLFVVCFLLLAVFIITDKHPKTAAAKEKSNSLYRVLSLFKAKNVLPLCFFSFCYVGFATSISTWLPAYMKEEFRIQGFLASYPVVAFWAGIIAGRIVYSYWSQKYNLKRLIFISNLTAGVVVLISVLANTYISFIVGLAVAGFFTGAANPLAYAILNADYPSQKGAVSSALTFFEALGVMAVPWLVGVIAEKAGFYFGMLSLFILPLAISVFSLFVTAQTDYT